MRLSCICLASVALLSLVASACDKPPKEPPPLDVVPAATTPLPPRQETRGDPPPRPEFVAERVWSDGAAMGTKVLFSGYTTDKHNREAVKEAFAQALVEIKRIEDVMTTWREDSELSRVNQAAGKAPVKVSDETFFLLDESVKTSAMSEGTFDITFEGLHGVWKFDQDLDPHPPTPAQVRAKLPLVGYRHIVLNRAEHTVRLDKPGVKISLGGIAKGYAVDRAAEVLDKAGLTSYFIQAGGDLYARGTKPDGQGWLAGIRDPRGMDQKSFAMIALSDHAFSTAGDYERSYIAGGKRYHHIIDPRTGYPATASRSVTIWAKTALQADAIDDAVFILGPEKGLKLVESIAGVGAVIVDTQNKVWISERLRHVVRVTSQPTDGI